MGNNVGFFVEYPSFLENINYQNQWGVHPDSLSYLPPLPGNFSKNVDEPEFIIDKRVKPNPYGDEVQLSSRFSGREWQAYLNSYYRLTELVDKEIGEVIEALKRNGMYENSLLYLLEIMVTVWLLTNGRQT